MDHLCLPSTPTRPPPRVRHVAQPYDGGPFLGYPERHPLRRSAPQDEFESFVQTWLYFGLLQEVLGPHLDIRKYVARDDHGPIICSSSLYADLAAWVARSLECTAQHRNATLNHIASCLERASIFALYGGDLDQGIPQSVAALGEAISEAVMLAVDEDWDGILPSVWISLYAIDDVRRHMQRHGWCPTEVVKAVELLHTVDALYYAERLSKPDADRKHRDCTTQLCVHAKIDAVTYRPHHVCASGCELIGPYLSDVIHCLTSGVYPLLRITGDTLAEVGIDVVPYRGDLPYVALSHVWSDGLGNPEAMKLPCCRILRLKGMMDHLHGQGSSDGDCSTTAQGNGFLLWCDTLCCPVEPHLKPLALERMRDVYQNAAYVLVLDNSLIQYDTGVIGMRESAVRLPTSTWTGRLWTLRESALAERLLIRFADRILDMIHLTDAARESCDTGLTTRAIDQEIFQSLFRSTGFALRSSFQYHNRWALAAESVRFRQASNPSDEALCLATLLDLDLSLLSRVNPNERMKTFWVLLARTTEGIAQDIIFNGFRRLDHVGFRWAPASFLDSDATDRRDSTPTSAEGPKDVRSRLTSRGLRVIYPALLLHTSTQPTETIANLHMPFDMFWHKVHLCHHDRHWYEISYLGKDGGSSDLTLWQQCLSCPSSILIMSQLPERNELGGQDALFTSPGRGSDTVAVVHTRLSVVIHGCTDHEDRLWNATMESGHILRCELKHLAGRDGIDEDELSEILATRCKELAQLIQKEFRWPHRG